MKAVIVAGDDVGAQMDGVGECPCCGVEELGEGVALAAVVDVARAPCGGVTVALARLGNL